MIYVCTPRAAQPRIPKYPFSICTPNKAISRVSHTRHRTPLVTRKKLHGNISIAEVTTSIGKSDI